MLLRDGDDAFGNMLHGRYVSLLASTIASFCKPWISQCQSTTFRDVDLSAAMAAVSKEQAAEALGKSGRGEEMSSEEPLFILHTSGSTGKPKGLLHTVAGYLLYASLTFRNVFDFHEGDILSVSSFMIFCFLI